MTPGQNALNELFTILGNAVTFGDRAWAVGLIKSPFNVGDDLNDLSFVGAEADGAGYAQLAVAAAARTYSHNPVTQDNQLILDPPAGGFQWGTVLATMPGAIYGFFAVPGAPGAWHPGDNSGNPVWAMPFDTPIPILDNSDLVIVPKVSFEQNKFGWR